MDGRRLHWPLLGRARELDLVETLLAEQGPARGLILTSGQGVGKSRLLRAAVERARSGGYVPLSVFATRAAASVPLAAVSHLIGVLPPEPTAADLAAHLHRAATNLRPAGLGTADVPGQKVFLAVDDAHLLDAASAAFVHHVVVHGDAIVVMAVDADTRPPDAVDVLWKDELLRRVDLRPLPDETIDELITGTFAEHVTGTARTRLRRAAAGNPLYLRELIHAAAVSGSLHLDADAWRLYGPLPGGDRLADLIDTRLDAVDHRARAVVEIAALGEPLPLTLVESDHGFQDAEKAGLLTVTTCGQRNVVRLAQPVYGEVLRTRMPAGRVRAVHRLLAQRLATTPMRRAEDHLLLAVWQLAGGLPAEPTMLVRAARHAATRLDLAHAERCARAAADAGDPEATRLLADILHWRGRPTESAALLAPTPPRRVGPGEEHRWAVSRTRTLFWGLSRPGDARAALASAEASPDTAAVRALMALSNGDCHTALTLATPVLDTTTVHPESRVWAYNAAAAATAVLGQTGHALQLADDGLRLASRHRDEILIAGPHLQITRTYVHLLAGRLSDARSQATAGYHHVLDSGMDGLAAQWAALLGTIAQLQGDLPAAVNALRDATALAERHDPNRLLRVHRSVLAGVLAMTGDIVAAERALRHADHGQEPVPALHAPQVEANRAWVIAAAGDQHRAAAAAIRGAEQARSHRMATVEALLLYDAVRHGAAHRAHTRLGELSDQVDSELVKVYAAAAAATAAGDGPLLEKAAEAFDDLDAPLLAAETAVTAARAYHSAGRPHDAAAAAERARTMAQCCRQARTPALLTGPPATLTPRERQIALLAARALSSTEIAQQLNISPRTVENHLAHSYAKLGVTNRTELAAALLPSQ